MKSLKRILLVEDNLRDIELTLAALAEYNVANEVVVARDGLQALDYLYGRGVYADKPNVLPCVIFLDLKMPKMDGLEVLRQVRTSEQLRLIPVVMITSSREECDVLESYRLGVNGYVVKPIDFHQFVDAIKQVGAFWAVLNEVPPAGKPEPPMGA